MDIPSDSDFLRLNELHVFLRVSKSSIFRLIKTEDFPKPFIVAGVKLWKKSEVLEYLEKSRSETLSDLED